MNNLSAYIHIPFCRRKCNYCDFYSAPPTPGAVSSYAEALCRQIRQSEAMGASLKTVYFGGGTPSLLSGEEFSLIVTALRETFDLSACVEFTVECNPESVSAPLVQTWLLQGVNRVSMGVQTFSDRHLSRLARLHTASRAREAYWEMRAGGVQNISLDLMIALPEQTEAELLEDLQKVLSLSPEHLSVYLLKVEPNSSFGKTGVLELHEDVQRTMYLLADGVLSKGGYEHYEISNFARPGFRARHNNVYWTGGEYLGFGPGASGFYQGMRYHIPADTALFCEQKGRVSPCIDELVDARETLRERIMLGLRLSDGIDPALIPLEKNGFVRSLCKSGLAVLSEDRFALTPKGFLVSDQVISALLPEK